MRFSLDILGWTLDWTLEPTAVECECDPAHDLSGGTLGTDRIDAGPTDRYLGFTNGRECEDD